MKKIKLNILLKILLSYLLIFILTFILSYILFGLLNIKEHLLLFATISIDTSLVLVVLLLLWLWKFSISEFLGVITLKKILLVIGLSIVIKLMLPLFSLNNFIFDSLEGKLKIFEFQRPTYLLGEVEYAQLYFDLKSLIIAPFFEEILFRGIFIKKITEKYSSLVAILLSSLLFALYHMDFDQSIMTFFTGIILGIIYFRTRNLSLVIAIHFFINLFAVFLMEKTVQLDGLYYVLFCIYPLLILLVYLIIKKFTIVNQKNNL